MVRVSAMRETPLDETYFQAYLRCWDKSLFRTSSEIHTYFSIIHLDFGSIASGRGSTPLSRPHTTSYQCPSRGRSDLRFYVSKTPQSLTVPANVHPSEDCYPGLYNAVTVWAR